MLTVHLRVNDESTGRPVPVWLRIIDADGRYYPPLGRLDQFTTAPGREVGGQVRLGSETFAFIDGTCEARLPAGTLHVEIERGPEYSPVSREVNLATGQLSLRFSIGRWLDWSADGWFSGDIRAHELTPAAAALEGAASGLSVVQLLARERPPRDGEPAGMVGLLEFSGDRLATDAHGCQVAVNTMNSHPILGTVSLLNCHRPVFPLRFGAPDGLDDWSVADWCDQCHRKRGLVVWPDLPRLTPEHLQGEALASMILGKIDAFEIGPIDDPQSPVFAEYYRLLDCGLRPVLVGGSGKDSNASVLGSMRTYACVLPLTPPSPPSPTKGRGGEEAASAAGGKVAEPSCSPPLPFVGEGGLGGVRGWLDAVRAGRTFVTTAPLLSLTVAGQGPGSVLTVEPGARVRLRAEAHSPVPFDYLELIVNGEVQATKTASGNRTYALLETDYVCQGSAWIASACYAPAKVRSGACVFAHTSPVFLDVPGSPLRPSPETTAPLFEILALTRAWVEREARPETEKQRQHLLAVLDESRDRLTSLGG